MKLARSLPAILLLLAACSVATPSVTEDLDPNRTDGGAAESTCERVASAFLEIEDGHDRIEDLDAAIGSCESFDAVEAAADLLGDRIDQDRLVDAVADRCNANEALEGAQVCEELRP